MGCSAQRQTLSPAIRAKALMIFKRMDINNSGSIDKEETTKFWNTNFAKVNTAALFKAVDFDKSGEITEDEWMAFWDIVRKSGHTEQEINEELDNLLDGKAWVQFRKVDEFVKRDQMKRKSQIKQIVQDNQKRMSLQTETVQSFQPQHPRKSVVNDIQK